MLDVAFNLTGVSGFTDFEITESDCQLPDARVFGDVFINLLLKQETGLISDKKREDFWSKY